MRAHHICLHKLVGCVCRKSARSGHCALIESALRAVAVVAAIAQQDRALLAHRVIGCIDASSVEHHRQLAALRVAAHAGPVVWLALCDGGHKSPIDAWKVYTEFRSIGVRAAHQIILLVGHHPRAGRLAVKPRCGIAIVGGFHRAVVVVAAISLRIAVVEAASVVEVQAVDHPILALRLIVNRGTLRVVLAKAHSRLNEYAIDLVTHDRHRRHVGKRNVVEPSHCWAAESAARRLGQIVLLARLVIDRCDPTVCVGAELVLRGRVGISACIGNGRGTRLNDADVQRFAI